MKCSVSLGFLLLGCLTDAFSNGPGSRLQNGGHSAHYEAILPLSEELIATEIGENSTALAPYSRNTTVDDIGTSPVDARSVFKRQDGRPAGALKCGPGSPCIDESCCGSVSIVFQASRQHIQEYLFEANNSEERCVRLQSKRTIEFRRPRLIATGRKLWKRLYISL